MNFSSVESLAHAVERWCRENRVEPANGQASTEISPRNVRYYRTMGLLDGPSAASEAGAYGEKHFLQLAAIRLLQANGLPLRRIQQLLMGRSIDDLRKIQRNGVREMQNPSMPALAFSPEAESWRVTPIDGEWLVVSRRGRSLTPELVAEMRNLLDQGVPASRSANPPSSSPV